MEDKTATPERIGLLASVHNFIWLADLGLRKQDRLNTHEADALRRARKELQLDLRRLQKALLKVRPLGATEASEIERCVADLLRNAGWVCHLLPVPTPNARKAVVAEHPKRARDGKAKKPRMIAIKQASDAVFATWVKAQPPDWNRKKGTSKIVGQRASKFNDLLKRQGFKELSRAQILRHLQRVINEYG